MLCNEPFVFADSVVLSSCEEICAKDKQVGCPSVSVKRKEISVRVHFAPLVENSAREREDRKLLKCLRKQKSKSEHKLQFRGVEVKQRRFIITRSDSVYSRLFSALNYEVSELSCGIDESHTLSAALSCALTDVHRGP